MKICQTSTCFYPALAYGGMAKVAYELSKRLAEKKHEIIVYTTDAMDINQRVKGEIQNFDGIKVFYFKNISNTLSWHQRISISIGMIPVIKKSLNSFDIIHVHGFRDFQSIVINHYANKYNIPYIIQPHGSIPHNNKKIFKKIFDIIFGYKILRDADKIFVLNKTEGDACKGMGVNADKIESISNGIDLSEYRNLPNKGLFRQKYDIAESTKIVLYLGRIHKNKGIDLLFKAFAEVEKKTDDVKLVICGIDDGYLKALKELSKSINIKSEVLFTGFLPDKDKISAFIDANVFVTPSFTGFPLTFLEAMVCGVPILTTDKGDFIDGIDNKVGFVVKYDQNELTRALRKILTDDDLSKHFRRNGQKIIKRYEWAIIINRIEEIYEKIRINTGLELIT
ncbi:MAG: glycosyltransferase [Candidatus Methanoperedens sp.]